MEAGAVSEEQSDFRVVHRRTWQGQCIEVVDSADGRALFFDSHLVQSRMAPDDPIRLVLPYSRQMMVCLPFLDGAPERVLLFGLGGGSLVKFLLFHFPECRVEVVEVNEGMAELARCYFHLPPESGHLTVHVADAARFVDRSIAEGAYDLILVDAFDGQGMARSLAARAFFDGCRRLLTKSGVMVVNVTRSDGILFEIVREMVQDCFPGGMLTLPVARTNNEIFFACQRPMTETRRLAVARRAAALEEWLDLELVEPVGRLCGNGGRGWLKWLGLG